MNPLFDGRGRQRWARRAAFGLIAAILLVVNSAGLAVGPHTVHWASPSVEAAPNQQGDGVLQGYAPGIFRTGQNPDNAPSSCPSVAQLREDVRHISEGQLANAIRGYGQSCNEDQWPTLALEVNPPLSVYAMTYCFRPQNSSGVDQAVVKADIDKMIAGYRSSVKAHMVCNEASEPEFWQAPNQSRVDPATLVGLLAYARQKQQQAGISVPITTADIAKDAFGRGWLDPQYIRTVGLAVDIIVAHVHPYWDDRCVDAAADWVMNRLNEVKAAYPGKTVVLGETGWPTAGSARALGCAPGNAAPSVANQERFLRDLLPKLQAANQSAFYFEGYDEPWKAGEGGTGVGDHWGTHLVSGACKHNVPSVMFSQLRSPGTAPPAAACQPRVVTDSPAPPRPRAATGDGVPDARISLLQAQSARDNGLAPGASSVESASAPPAASPLVAALAEQDSPLEATARAEEPESEGAPVEASGPLDQPPASASAPLDQPPASASGPPDQPLAAASVPLDQAGTPTPTPTPLATPTPSAAATATVASLVGQGQASAVSPAPAQPAQMPGPFPSGPFTAPPPLLPPLPPLLPPLPPSAPVLIIPGAAVVSPASPIATLIPSLTPTPTPTRTTTPVATPTSVSAGLAFVANAGSGNISVFNAPTGQFVVDIPLPGGAVLPLDLAINRNGSRLFSSNRDNVSVFDLTSRRALGNIALPTGAVDPIELAIQADGSFVYVANSGSRNVSVLDGNTLQPLRNIPLPPGADTPSSIGIHPNGSRLYVANARSGNVSVLDTTTNQPLVNVPLGVGSEFPVCIAVNPAGTRVYTANLVTRNVSVLDAVTNQLLATIPLPPGADGPVHLVVNPDGTRLYTANNTTSNVSVLDLTTNRALLNIPLPPGAMSPLALGLNPDGSRLYTVNDSNIAVLDPIAGRPLSLFALHDDLSPAAIVVR